MRRRRSFQFVESGGPELVELLETQGYDWVREKHPEAAKDEDEMGQHASSKQLAF
jgi:Fe-S cluster assembly ATP-binding protein